MRGRCWRVAISCATSGGHVVETPDELLRRVARAVAAAEARHGSDAAAWEAKFYEAMARLELLPNSPTLMNAGKPSGQLSACFVLPVGDAMPEIFDAVKWAAMIQQTGGGTGFAFSRLRPAGDIVRSTMGVASGPVSFIEVFNTATDAIRQGGVRRGANMGILRVDHPDVLEFISAKSDPRRLRNFNVSVAITDEFMRALDEGRDYALRNPRSGAEVRRLDARRVWQLIAQLAWKSGEPGVIFIDRINAQNPTPALGEMESTNPCGELPLLPFEACNLASIDVGKLVVDGKLDWPRLADRVGTRRALSRRRHRRQPLPAAADRRDHARQPQDRARRHGLRRRAHSHGRRLRLRSGARASPTSWRASSSSTRRRRRRSWRASGDRSRNLEGIALAERDGSPPLRNATTTTIAPTGTLSILAGCSGGIEPLYAVSFVRQVLDGDAAGRRASAVRGGGADGRLVLGRS